MIKNKNKYSKTYFAELLLRHISNKLTEDSAEMFSSIFNETFSEKEQEELPYTYKLAFMVGVQKILEAIIISINKSVKTIRSKDAQKIG